MQEEGWYMGFTVCTTLVE